MARIQCLLLPLGLVTLVGCQGSGSEPPPSRAVEVRLFYPSELQPILEPAVARFNAAPISKDGMSVRVSALHADGAAAGARVANEPPEIPVIWLSSSSLSHGPLASGYPSSGMSLAECRSLASSDIGAAFRASDGFLVEEHGSEALFAQFVSPSSEPDPAKVPLIFMGLPGSSASGLAAYLMTCSAALKIRPQSLSALQVQGETAAIEASQVRFARYFPSDPQMLAFTASLHGGQPAIALTTAQQVKAHNTRMPAAPLTFVRAGVPSFSLDYPVCAVRHAKLSPELSEAQRSAMQEIFGPELQAQLAKQGFGPPSSEGSTEEAGTALALLNLWPSARKPSLSAFVIDTSSNVPQEILAPLERELQAFSSRPAVARDSLTLISTSTRPELLAPASTDHSRFREAVKALPSSGALALREGIALAMSLVTDAPLSQYRGVIIAVVTGQDTASAISAASLAQRSLAAISRRGTSLYIVGITGPASQPGQLSSAAQLAADLGGTYVETSIQGIPTALRGIFQEIE